MADRPTMISRSMRAAAGLMTAVLVVLGAACGGDDGAPGVGRGDAEAPATYEFVIWAGAGEAIDAGEEVELVPPELDVRVGESIRIINEDDRGHTIGPFFVGAGETLTQEFFSPGQFEGVCSVHPSGRIVLNVRA